MKKMTCYACSKNCQLTLELVKGELKITGQGCQKGAQYVNDQIRYAKEDGEDLLEGER